MKHTLNIIFIFLGVGSIVTNILLYHQMRILPDRMQKAIGQPKDTVQVVKMVSDKLPKKGELIYYAGKCIDKPVRLDDEWQYNPEHLPDEVWGGYAYLSESVNGAKYYLWSQRNDYPEQHKIEGWFITIGQRMQVNNTEEYVPMLFPVVPRNKKPDLQ